jgi:hypothetical protein
MLLRGVRVGLAVWRTDWVSELTTTFDCLSFRLIRYVAEPRSANSWSLDFRFGRVVLRWNGDM